MSKRALVVGVNDYPGTGSDLFGCVNDAQDWAVVLGARGYQVGMLVDRQATKANILAGLEDLILHAQDGDTLAFTFSGHGSWLPDTNGDEPDGRDEMLCPYDVARGQYVMDDDLHALFSKKARGARLFLISDSCHSGSVTRASAFGMHEGAPRIRFLPPLEFVTDEELCEKIPLVPRKVALKRPDPFPALLLSGCRDTEYSYDAGFNGRPNGALTRVAIDALKNHPATPQEWHKLIRRQLPSRSFPQSPQLYGSTSAKRGQMF